MKPQLISVVICTYNRADLLADVLQTICAQTLDRTAYEVIVVDNNSTDESPIVGHDFALRYANVRYCLEVQQGLSHARNRGWQEAKGDYVAYIDDDCKVPEGWLAVATEIFHRFAPTVFGGPYFGFFNTPKPDWFKATYGSHEPYSTAQFLDAPDKLHGGNLFIQRKILAAVGGFDPTFGMNGEKIAYGEESALLEQIREQFPTSSFYYDPDLFVYHLVRPEKMTWRRTIRQRFNNGRAVYQIYHQGAPSQGKFSLYLSIGKKCVHISYSVTAGLLLRNRMRFPHAYNYLYEESARHFVTLGWLYEQVQHSHKPKCD